MITIVLSASAVAGFLLSNALEDRPQTDVIETLAGLLTRPDFVLNDPDGVPRSSAEWNGSPLLINFWATWCAPCRREIPMLKQIYAQQSSRGLKLVGIAVDFPDAVARYLSEMEIDYPLRVGDEDAIATAESLGLRLDVLPATVFSLSDGRILYRHIGELHQAQADLVLEVLWQIESGQTGLEQGQRRIFSEIKGPTGDKR